MRYLLFFSVLMLVWACQSNPESTDATTTNKSTKSLEEAMPGVWETVSVRVEVNSAEGKDSSYVFEVSEETWETDLGIKPIKTYYELDNKFRSEYRGAANDTLINVNKGLWNTIGDTLMLIEPTVTYIYKVTLFNNGTGEFRSLLDWDGDGLPDDQYIGTQRYVSKSTQ
ncbi:MAG: hypothetical protein AAF798_13595 [Bacteroidota bacterium]